LRSLKALGGDNEADARKGLIIFQKRVVGLSEASLERFVRAARRAVGLKGTVNVLLTGNVALRTLNQRFRAKNQATDVLSFPAALCDARKKYGCAGEIAISADIAARNALQFGHPAAQEVKILALHGILHLAGFDHEGDNGQMARKETSLREKLGLPSGLIERTERPAKKADKRKVSRASAGSTA
jgi:probable rRNA maturation factor